MTTKIIKGVEVTRPDTTPLASSVLDHATVKDVASFGLRNNEGLWPSYNCLDTRVPTTICPDPVSEKIFGSAEWQPAFEFAVHGGVQCSAVGLDTADQKSEIARVFALNEGKAIEEALLGTRFVADPGGAWGAPVNLTPGSAITLQTALAILEGYAAAHYAGVPTIHMPRAAASLLNERIVWIAGQAYTRSGSKVAIGGGYDAEGTPDGAWDLYATGEVYVERSEEVSVQTHVVPGDGSGLGSDENGLADNTVIALVERMYRVAVDCFAAKVTATVWV